MYAPYQAVVPNLHITNSLTERRENSGTQNKESSSGQQRSIDPFLEPASPTTTYFNNESVVPGDVHVVDVLGSSKVNDAVQYTGVLSI